MVAIPRSMVQASVRSLPQCRSWSPIEMNFYLLTYHGTVVCHDQNGWLVHRPLLEWTPATWQYCAGNQIQLAADVSASKTDNPLRGVRFNVIPAAERGLVHLQYIGQYLRAQPHGVMDGLPRQASGWESFLLISQDEFDLLRHLATHHWTYDDGEVLVSKEDISVGENFCLQVGRRSLRLCPGFPVCAASGTGAGARDLLIFDTWKVLSIKLFRPLIYLTAFGSKHAAMAITAVTSFEHNAELELDYLVITDQPIGLMQEMLRPTGIQHVHFSIVHPQGFVDFCVQRFLIAEWPLSEQFQPLLYVDTDVMCDRSLSPLLQRIAFNPHISVSYERFTDLLSTPSVGSDLVTQDPARLRTQAGFNSGIIGIPNASSFRLHLRAAAEVVWRYAAANGPDSLGWFDQACANYAWAKLGCTTEDELDEWVESLPPNGSPSGARRGLVHFWGLADKPEAMKAYLTKLQRSPAVSPA